MDDLATLYSILSDFVLQIVMTVPGLRHVLDNGTIIFPPFPATDLEPSLHSQGLCPDSDLTISFFKKKLKREESRDLLYSLDTVYTGVQVLHLQHGRHHPQQAGQGQGG